MTDFFAVSSLYMNKVAALTPYPEGPVVLGDFPFIVSQLLCGCLCWARHCFWYCSETEMRYNGCSQKTLQSGSGDKELGRRKRKTSVSKGMKGQSLTVGNSEWSEV